MKHQTVIGVFRNHVAARRAVERLIDEGFNEDKVGVIAQDPEHRYVEEGDEGSHAGEGAAIGAGAGAAGGALWALGIAAGLLPAIGPVIAGGTLAAIIASAGVGAAAAGVAGALIGMGIPEEEAKYYEKEFHRGNSLVTVHADARSEEVKRILQEEGAHDFTTRDTYTSDDPIVRYEEV